MKELFFWLSITIIIALFVIGSFFLVADVFAVTTNQVLADRSAWGNIINNVMVVGIMALFGHALLMWRRQSKIVDSIAHANEMNEIKMTAIIKSIDDLSYMFKQFLVERKEHENKCLQNQIHECPEHFVFKDHCSTLRDGYQTIKGCENKRNQLRCDNE